MMMMMMMSRVILRMVVLPAPFVVVVVVVVPQQTFLVQRIKWHCVCGRCCLCVFVVWCVDVFDFNVQLFLFFWRALRKNIRNPESR